MSEASGVGDALTERFERLLQNAANNAEAFRAEVAEVLKPLHDAYTFWSGMDGGVHDDNEIDDQGKLKFGYLRRASALYARLTGEASGGIVQEGGEREKIAWLVRGAIDATLDCAAADAATPDYFASKAADAILALYAPLPPVSAFPGGAGFRPQP